MPVTSANAPIATYLDDQRAVVDHALRNALPGSETPSILREAVAYSVLAGGKRIRPILALAACEAVGADSHRIVPLVVSLEFVHTYSLIHDDLPAMDDDDLRRGCPTNHRVFGEDMAILAGDALQALAFAALTDSRHGGDLPAAVRLAAVAELAAAAGAAGLVGGQALDLRAAAPPSVAPGDQAARAAALATLDDIHARKTGALIRAAVRMGAILGRATEAQLPALTRYGEAVGLLFQIADDVLDVEATAEEMGKATGKDRDRRKWAYPAVVGVAASREIADTCLHDALDALSGFPEAADPLRGIARYILDRRS
ncbi:MAG: polyprenyl synthetase family protein [Nitrospirota bacterium]